MPVSMESLQTARAELVSPSRWEWRGYAQLWLLAGVTCEVKNSTYPTPSPILMLEASTRRFFCFCFKKLPDVSRMHPGLRGAM